jgi:hypothetical protein
MHQRRRAGGMRCFPPFININPCRGVVDDDKVRDKIGEGGSIF